MAGCRLCIQSEGMKHRFSLCVTAGSSAVTPKRETDFKHFLSFTLHLFYWRPIEDSVIRKRGFIYTTVPACNFIKSRNQVCAHHCLRSLQYRSQKKLKLQQISNTNIDPIPVYYVPLMSYTFKVELLLLMAAI